MTARGAGTADAGDAAGAAASLFTPLALSLPASVPFVGPEALERRIGTTFLARLGANENVFGPSPQAVEAMAREAARSWAYGDPELHELKAALAARLGLRPENVSVGEGIDGLLGHLVRLTCEPGARVLSSRGAYPTFNFHVAGHGGVLDLVPYRDDRQDVDALIERAQATRPRLAYFANPDNPTGSVWPAADVVRLIEGVPRETLLILDEAYGEFAPEGTMPPVGLMRPNLLRLRTFSKAYGLAGARVGYVFGEGPAIAQFDKVRNHFGVSRMSAAGALAALGDAAHLAETVLRVAAARDALATIARDAGLTPLPSATNFVAIDCGSAARAQAILDGVLARRVFIRKPGVAPLDRLIRVTVGPAADLAHFADALRGTLAALGPDGS